MRGPIPCRDCGAHLSSGNAFLHKEAPDQRCWQCREANREATLPMKNPDACEDFSTERTSLEVARHAKHIAHALPARICNCPHPNPQMDEDGDVSCLKCAHSLPGIPA